MSERQPWKPRAATDKIRAIARSPKLALGYKLHAREQMEKRGIIVSDVLFVLKFGFVLIAPEPATKLGSYRYAMDNKTPNSDSRDIRLIVIPDEMTSMLELVTVMWVDELASRAGSIIR